jgi:hypothetical protein
MTYSGLDYLETKHQQWIDSNPSIDFDHEALFRELCEKHPLLDHEWMVLTATLIDMFTKRGISPVAPLDN